jgi:hypothetical protein
VVFKTELTKSGKFFEVDPAKVFRQNVQDFMAAVAREGEKDVQGQLRAGESGRFPLGGGIRPGRVSGHVVGRVHSLTGKHWTSTAVVSVNASGLDGKQAIKLKAAASGLEAREHAIRRTAGRLRRSAAVNTADLFKGLR